MIHVTAVETELYPIFVIYEFSERDDSTIEVHEDFIKDYHNAMKIFWDMQQKVRALYEESHATNESNETS